MGNNKHYEKSETFNSGINQTKFKHVNGSETSGTLP